jgi:hypothetical protein
MRMVPLMISSVIALLSAQAIAQTIAQTTTGAPAPPPAAPVRIVGTIEQLAGRTLTVKTPEGSAAIALPENLRITNNRKASLAEIGSGVFVGTTAVLRKDGKLHATEVHIFPEAMRGTGEGHRPWFAADTTMTNGSVTTMTNGSAQQKEGANGEVVLKVAYKGGEQEVHVAPDVPITMLEAGDMSMLKPGAPVVGLVRPNPDGGAVALMISVGGFF